MVLMESNNHLPLTTMLQITVLVTTAQGQDFVGIQYFLSYSKELWFDSDRPKKFGLVLNPPSQGSSNKEFHFIPLWHRQQKELFIQG